MPQCIMNMIMMVMMMTIIIITITRQFFCYTKAACQSICSPSARTLKVLKTYRYQVGNTVDVTCSVTGI